MDYNDYYRYDIKKMMHVSKYMSGSATKQSK